MDEVRVIRVVIDLDGSAFSAPSVDASDGSVTPSSAISASTGGGGGSGAGGGSGGDGDGKRFRRYITKSRVLKYANVAVGYAEEMINSYYNLEENYKANTDVTNIKTAINGVSSIVQGAVSGAAVGGWIGAIIGGVTATVKQGIEVGKTYMSEAERLAELAYNKRYKSEALGLIDGSRGTEN